MKYITERGENIAKAKRMPTKDFIQKANLIHNNQYSYENVEYINAHTKVEIICPLHGPWNQRPADHITGGCGCPACGNTTKGSTKSATAFNKFLNFAKIKHNNKYEYILESYNGMTKTMKMICPTHGEFFQVPDVHKRAGCQRCGSGPISESSQQWLNYIGIDQCLREHWLKTPAKNFKVDAYDPTTNTVYEFLGDYWHGNPKVYPHNNINSNNKRTFGDLYQETIERISALKSMGYNVIHIWESEWKSLIPISDSTPTNIINR